MNDQSDPYIIKIRDEYFHIEIFLYNQLDGRKAVNLPFSFVDSFSITESLLTYNTNGWIIINTDFEVLERGGTGANIDSASINATSDDCYIFRTDGRNKISFRLYHLNKSGTASFPPKYWEMCYDFVIYDSEDIQTYSNQTKMRKYKFWDERYQILSERNIDYSTVYSSIKSGNISITENGEDQEIDPTTLEDKYRCCTPNLALKDIIKTAASNPPVMGLNESSDKMKVGFLYVKDGGTIENPTQPMDAIDSENWDEGDSNNIGFYTSPANATAVEDIEYVLGHCTDLNGYPTFLQFGRSTNDKSWKLLSLEKLIKDSTNNQVESLYIEDAVASSGPPISRADTSTTIAASEETFTDDRGNISIKSIGEYLTDTSNNSSISNIKNFTSAIASRITSYSFCPMLSLEDDRITNHIIHNYDFSTGTFKIHMNNNRAKDVKNALEQIGKGGLYSFSDNNTNKGNAHVLLTLNQTKTKGIMLKNTLKPQRFFPKNIGLTNMIRDGLVYNQALNFKAQGLTLRSPGKFIAINRIGSDGKLNPFDDRFLGQWMIMDVEHVFTKTSYHNNVVAVKIDTFSKLWTSKTEEQY